MTDKEMLLFVLNRAKERGIIGNFFDANNETTDEIHNTWKAYQKEAEQSEEELILSKAVERYLSSYYGITMLKSYNLDDYGLWTVRGEDHNCDLGGPHSMPLIGHYEGRLEDAVKVAVMHPNFYTWGGGGKVEQMAPANQIIKLEEI